MELPSEIMSAKYNNPVFRFILRFIVVPIAALIILVVLIYGFEDVRGWYVWRHYKAQSASRGVSLDWTKFVPAPVPDDKNFFKQPDMQAWFVGQGDNAFSQRLSFQSFPRTTSDQENSAVGYVNIVPLNAAVHPGEADIVLDYHDQLLSLALDPENPSAQAARDEVIPLIVMDTVPLRDAIRNLARQMGMNYRLAPDITNLSDEVTLRWENMTARTALINVLHNYGLDLLPAAAPDIARIVRINSPGTLVHVEPAVSDALAKLVGDAFKTSPDGKPRRYLAGAIGLDIATRAESPFKRTRIVVRADHSPTAGEVKEFFPRNPLTNTLFYWTAATVEAKPDGKNFQLHLVAPEHVAAEDYLAWSDAFTNDFAKMSTALELPFARMEGDYSNPTNLPKVNFLVIRTVAQMLAQRTQCHLLLNQPGNALHDLTLLHQLSRIMVPRPGVEPASLIATMMNVAVTGLYVQTLADGFRLQLWRETDLAELQRQLAEINLLPSARGGVMYEAALQGHEADTMSSRDLAEFHAQYFKNFEHDKYKDPAYRFLSLAPHGWIYQNLAQISRVQQGLLETFDGSRGQVLPGKAAQQARERISLAQHHSPYTYYASVELADFTQMAQTTAKNQTLANEALIVCGLERYRLARGKYPDTLEALQPDYASRLPSDIIGGAPLKYRIHDGEFTLYSIGWNEQDDGGTACWDEIGMGDAAKNDWAWPYQARTAQRNL